MNTPASMKTHQTDLHAKSHLALAEVQNRMRLVWKAYPRQSMGATRQPLDLPLLPGEILAQPKVLTCKASPSAKTVSQPWQRELQSGIRRQTEVMPNQPYSKLILAREKLTRAFFLTLPDGVYVMSNIFLTPARSAYEARVAPKAQRSQQWQGVPKNVRHRLCSVFRCKPGTGFWLMLLTKSALGVGQTPHPPLIGQPPPRRQTARRSAQTSSDKSS